MSKEAVGETEGAAADRSVCPAASVSGESTLSPAIQSAASALDRAYAESLDSLRLAHKSALDDALAGREAMIQQLTDENAYLRRALAASSTQISELTQALHYHMFTHRAIGGDTQAQACSAAGRPIDVESSVEAGRASANSASLETNRVADQGQLHETLSCHGKADSLPPVQWLS